MPVYWIFMCRLEDGAISQRAEVTVSYSSAQVGFAAGRNSNFVYILDKKYFFCVFLQFFQIGQRKKNLASHIDITKPLRSGHSKIMTEGFGEFIFARQYTINYAAIFSLNAQTKLNNISFP